jgi:hypothetical protein
MLKLNFLVWQKIMLHCLRLKNINPNRDLRSEYLQALINSFEGHYPTGTPFNLDSIEDERVKKIIEQSQAQMTSGKVRRVSRSSPAPAPQEITNYANEQELRINDALKKLKITGLTAKDILKADNEDE